MNSVNLVGRLAVDPELKYTKEGLAVCSFNLAVNRIVGKNAPPDAPTCDFIRITCWRHTAEFVANYLTKGRLCSVEGRLEINQWVDREGGKHRDAQINANNVQALGPKPEDGNGSGAQPAPPSPHAAGPPQDDYHDPFAE